MNMGDVFRLHFLELGEKTHGTKLGHFSRENPDENGKSRVSNGRNLWLFFDAGSKWWPSNYDVFRGEQS